MSNSDDGRELVEMVARAMLASSGIKFMPGRPTTKEAFKLCKVALTAIEASGRKIVPVEPTEVTAEDLGGVPAGVFCGECPGVYQRACQLSGQCLAKHGLPASPKTTGDK